MKHALTSTTWRTWLPWISLLSAIALLQWADVYPELRLSFPFSSTAWYTLFTCHLVHMNLRHWYADSLGLLVIAWLFAPLFNWKSWTLTLGVTLFCVSVGLLLWHPGLRSYAGLSGILHGFFAMGCLLLYRSQPRLAVFLLTLFICKLLIEPLTGSLWQHDFLVATRAHDYGALGGLMSWLGWISADVRRH